MYRLFLHITPEQGNHIPNAANEQSNPPPVPMRRKCVMLCASSQYIQILKAKLHREEKTNAESKK